MSNNTMIDVAIRIVVAGAATMLTMPLLVRCRHRMLMRATVLGGVGLVLASVLIPFLRDWLNLPYDGWLGVAARLDAPGFAIILLGTLRGLRDMGRSRDELVRQNEHLREQASTDFLTGLLNRREAESLLEYGAVRARQSGFAVGFMMVDLDHFKQVNDVHGHQAGDAVLAQVGRLLKSHLRSSDIVARYGGEEFLIVVAEPSQESIVTLAEELRSLIERRPAEFEGKKISITASFGVAVSHVSTERAAREAISRADAALYAAKHQGRNRVVQWDELSAENQSACPGKLLRIA